MIVSVCLSRGALLMSRRKVIVKRLNSIQNLGAMDVLCTDKTGTLTMDRVILEQHCDVALKDDDSVLEMAFLNSHFQTGLKNILDRAILQYQELHQKLIDRGLFQGGRDSLRLQPQDDVGRRIASTGGAHRLICKGAPESVFSQAVRSSSWTESCFRWTRSCSRTSRKNTTSYLPTASAFSQSPIATSNRKPPITRTTSRTLILKGYIAFLDPPKETAGPAIAALQKHGVAVKVLTGDNELVSRKIGKEVGLSLETVLTGAKVAALSDTELADAAEKTTLFVRLSPADKQRVIKVLQSKGHVVGIHGRRNQRCAGAARADVGISVDTAVDIAKEAADIILLEKSLMVLEEGVIEGRKVFANIVKYVRMGASSNFGNMFSVLGASLWLPFLPMSPIKILTNNLLYDFSQVPIPTDDVDPEQVAKPRPWDMDEIARFILFIGPISSIFDYTTYSIMWFVFKCNNLGLRAAAGTRRTFAHATAANPDSTYAAALFQTGWFVESLLTQTLIIHVIRTNKIPFVQSRASWPLIVTSAAIMLAGAWLPVSPIGPWLGFVPLPAMYWPLLLATLLLYVMLTQLVKMWLVRQKWI